MFDDPKDDDSLSMKVGDFKRLIAREARLKKLLRRAADKIGEDHLDDEGFRAVYDAIKKELKRKD